MGDADVRIPEEAKDRLAAIAAGEGLIVLDLGPAAALAAAHPQRWESHPVRVLDLTPQIQLGATQSRW
ncbi:hypothetical protein ACFXKR_34135 [Streptomyces violascens]|uniref:hypothetical protein n=1 Tax=Streptomyces violascens TaxID=67381 RepID=UPI0036A3674B